MFKTILVSYDGSDQARHALETAVELSKAFGSEIHVSHTPQMEMPPIVVGSFVSVLEKPPTAEQIEEAGKRVADHAEAVVSAAGGTLTARHIGEGDPAKFTLAIAKKLNADLIVMGRRGLGAVASLALGSVSLAISHGAECACLTVE